MNKRYGRSVAIVLVSIFTLLFVFSPLALAHSGRTDSSGGHKDNKNKSGLGSYHYHCGGHPAHLHDGGGCPYDSSYDDDDDEPKATKKPTAEPTPKATQDPYTASKVEIEKPEDSTMDIYQSQKLTSSVYPQTALDGDITWSCADAGLDVSADGTLTAVLPGKYTVQAITSGGKSDSVTIKVSADRYLSPAKDFNYTSGEAGATITGYAGAQAFVSIPYKLDGSDVTAIGDGAFASADITKLRIPETVIQISGSAFGAGGVTLIVIPGSFAETFATQNGLAFELEYPAVLPLKKGSKCTEVKLIQQSLIEKGMLDDKADGIFGKNTMGAVEKYQLANGYTQTGEVDATLYEDILRDTNLAG